MGSTLQAHWAPSALMLDLLVAGRRVMSPIHAPSKALGEDEGHQGLGPWGVRATKNGTILGPLWGGAPLQTGVPKSWPTCPTPTAAESTLGACPLPEGTTCPGCLRWPLGRRE